MASYDKVTSFSWMTGRFFDVFDCQSEKTFLISCWNVFYAADSAGLKCGMHLPVRFVAYSHLCRCEALPAAKVDVSKQNLKIKPL